MEDEDLANAARQTLEAVQRRVEMELMAAPILVSAAMADSSHLSIKGISAQNAFLLKTYKINFIILT